MESVRMVLIASWSMLVADVDILGSWTFFSSYRLSNSAESSSLEIQGSMVKRRCVIVP